MLILVTGELKQEMKISKSSCFSLYGCNFFHMSKYLLKLTIYKT